MNRVAKERDLAEAEVRRLREYVLEWQQLCIKTERERDGLRKALAAYRSALRSGESETEQLRAFGDAALKGER